MKIKSKLVLNSFTILTLMAVIGTAAITGINYIQRNILVLTQKSTPYQIKTFDHQRALQEHASNLLKVAASVSMSEFKANSARSLKSLEEEIKTADDLIKLGSTSDYQHDLFTGNTHSIIAITDKRLAFQSETLAAIAAMKNSIGDASKKLRNLDSSIRKLQKNSAEKMLSNITINANGSNQSERLAAVQDILKDLSIYAIKIVNVTDKDVLVEMFEKSAGLFNELMKDVRLVQWTETRGEQDFAKLLFDLSDKFSEAKELQLRYIVNHDESVRTKAIQALRAAEKVILFLQTCARTEAGVFSTTQENSSNVMTASIAAFSDTNAILVLSSEIILSGAVIDSQINYSLSVRNIADFDATAALISAEFGKIDSTVGNLKAKLAKGKYRAEMTQLVESVTALHAVRAGYLSKDGAADKIRASLKNIDQVAKLNQQMREIVAKQMELSSRDIAVAQQSQEGAVASVKGAVKTTIVIIITIAVVAVLVSVALSRALAMSITRPIGELAAMAERFGEGDFNCGMDESRRDEFGLLAGHFNRASVKLGDMTRLLKESIQKLAAGSESLRETADFLHQGARDQASQTLHSSVAMTEITATVETVSGNAHDAAASSKEAHNIATRGKSAVTETVQGMHEIAEAVIAAATTMSQLSESSERISSILDTINDIADQTNLLALNAAIEAARAGEHGMGFAVVADEVRKLALRTSEATHEIADIVHSIGTDTERAVSAMNAGKFKVEEGVRKSSAASESLDAIVAVSQRSVSMAQMIASATDDQSKASREVSQGMEKIASITGALNDSTDQIKVASAELSDIAEELNQMASWFKATA